MLCRAGRSWQNQGGRAAVLEPDARPPSHATSWCAHRSIRADGMKHRVEPEPAVNGRAELDVASTPRSVALVRRYCVDACSRLGWARSATTVELLVSELATNAVVHASSDFEVTTHVDERSVRVEVADNSSTLPTVREPSLEATSGRGFHIVAALASGWGVRQSACGKVVWIELSAALR